MNMMSNMMNVGQSSKSNKKQITAFSKELEMRIKESFENHSAKVNQLNREKSFGGRNGKNDKADKIYMEIYELSVSIKEGILKNLRNSQRLRRQRKDIYQQKIGRFVETLQSLTKKKSIVIKVNEALERLVNQTKKTAEEAVSFLKNFEKQASQWCGKGHDYKIRVERSMTALCEQALVFEYIPRFESVTNDSVKEIYLPVQYDESMFKDLRSEAERLWPEPVVVEKVVEKLIEQQKQVPVVSLERLDEAHEMYFGFTRPQEPLRAIQIYKHQAEKSNPNPVALNALGLIYETGKFVKKDLKKALNYYLKSSKLNNPEGLYKIGLFLEKGLINTKEVFQGLYSNREAQIRGGIQFYEKAAKMDHLDAITDLGFLYENGVKNENDEFIIDPYLEVAFKYYMKAKKRQFPRAYNNIGSLLVRNQNIGNEQADGSNLEKGIKYLTRAKELNYPKACLNLGKCYENGLGVTENIDQARALYLQGIAMGEQTCRLEYIKTFLNEKIEDEKAMVKLGEICKELLLQESSNPEANFFMGLFAEKGIGMPQNKESAFYYIEKSADSGYAPAIVKLGDYYYSGYFVERNLQFARKLYEQAIEKGNSQALVNLGVMIEKGLVDSDAETNTASEYYEEAARLGNPNAVMLLGLNRNSDQSEFLVKAAELGSIDAVNILHKTQARLVPRKSRQNNTYEELMRKRSTMYCKENASSTLKSFSRSRSKRQHA